jgi:NDP-sugar pyrophosphorylase family protein
MQCVILAGGLGTRLGPMTAAVPKALVKVAGRPFAEHQLALLASWGIDDVVYCIGFGGRQIREFVSDGRRWGIRVRYSDEGNDLRGTAGALRVAHDQQLLDPIFAVIYGDSYLDLDAGAVWSAFLARRPAATMTVYRNEGRYDATNALVEDGLVTRYEKGLKDPLAAGMHHIDYGFSILDRDQVLPMIEPAQAFDLAVVFGRLSAERRLQAYEVPDRFYEIGSLAGIAALDDHLTAERAQV